MMNAREVLFQNDGDVTKLYYAELSTSGPYGELAVALFRAQKRSSRAKDYRRGKWRRAAYDVKSWSMGEVCRILKQLGAFNWGWKQDPQTVFGEEPSWVLYVDLPQGQVSFHSPSRLSGPDYLGDWDGQRMSADRICTFCDYVARVSRTVPSMK
jgi:hypothetical protein